MIGVQGPRAALEWVAVRWNEPVWSHQNTAPSAPMIDSNTNSTPAWASPSPVLSSGAWTACVVFNHRLNLRAVQKPPAATGAPRKRKTLEETKLKGVLAASWTILDMDIGVVWNGAVIYSRPVGIARLTIHVFSNLVRAIRVFGGCLNSGTSPAGSRFAHRPQGRRFDALL
jgi:hypothetical protein